MKRPKLLEVKPLDNYCLELTYADRKCRRIFDVKPYISGSWFEQLADKEYFSKVFIDGPSVAWPNEQGICPDELYELSKPVRKRMNVRYKKYNEIYKEMQSLSQEDTTILIVESQSEEEKDFYEMVSNFFLKRRQQDSIERNVF